MPDDDLNDLLPPAVQSVQNIPSQGTIPAQNNDVSDLMPDAQQQTAQQRKPIIYGDVLPMSKDQNEAGGGQWRFDPQGGITGAIARLPQLYHQTGVETAANTASPETAGQSLALAAATTPGDMVAPNAGSGALKARGVAIPSGKELLQTGGDQINQAGNMPVWHWPEAINDLADQAKGSLANERLYTDINAPQTGALLSKLGSQDPDTAVPLARLHAYRSQFSDLGKDLAGTQDGLAANHVVRLLDNFMEQPPPDAVFSGPAAEAAQLYAAGRGNYAAGKRDSAVQGLEYKADVQSANPHGGTYDSALRRKVQPLLDPAHPERLYGYDPTERAGIENIANGTPTRNFLGTASEWAGGRGHWQGAVFPLLAGSGGMEALGPAGVALGAVPPMAGAAMRAGEGALAKNAFNRLSETIRQRSPLYQERAKQVDPTLPNAVPPVAFTRAATAGATAPPQEDPSKGIYAQPEPGHPFYARGGKVKKPTHEFLVNRLMALAEKAKRAEKKSTAPILDMPDDAVTAALAKAQEAI